MVTERAGLIRLRDVVESDVAVFFEDQRDPEGVAMAAFASRPLHGFVARDNVGSIRVLEKCGFERTGTRHERR